MTLSEPCLLPDDIRLLERGWLSSNNIVLQAEQGVVVIDTGYASHAEQTLALIKSVVGRDGRLLRIMNTHLHSDHCGGNAVLAAAFNCPIAVPSGEFDKVLAWNDSDLSFQQTGQRCARFIPTEKLVAGHSIRIGRRRWELLSAPGHDPNSIIFFDPQDGWLISADALWQRGFGVVFPELEGVAGFSGVAASLDLIESLPVHGVLPGHGAAFLDVKVAIEFARQRLKRFEQDPQSHAWHAAKVMLKFHLLEVKQIDEPTLLKWLATTTITQSVWQRFFSDQKIGAWASELISQLLKSGAIARKNQMICDV